MQIRTKFPIGGKSYEIFSENLKHTFAIRGRLWYTDSDSRPQGKIEAPVGKPAPYKEEPPWLT